MVRFILLGVMIFMLGYISPAFADCLLTSKGETRREGTIVYNKDYDVMQACIGTRWKALGRIKPVEREACNPSNMIPGCLHTDGSVYAGITPDGDRPMFTTRCGYGRSWNGVSCEGAHIPRPWNSGVSGSDATPIAVQSLASGTLNTDYLMTLDSHTNLDGKQDFLAAKACADIKIHESNDWYLPALDELYVLYNNQDAIGDFMPQRYSTSNGGGTPAPYGSSLNWINFKDGSTGANTGVSSRFIRCTRKD